MDASAKAEFALSSEWLQKIPHKKELDVIVLKEFKIDTYFKGHQVYKDICTHEIGGSFCCAIRFEQ